MRQRKEGDFFFLIKFDIWVQLIRLLVDPLFESQESPISLPQSSKDGESRNLKFCSFEFLVFSHLKVFRFLKGSWNLQIYTRPFGCLGMDRSVQAPCPYRVYQESKRLPRQGTQNQKVAGQIRNCQKQL